MMPSEAIILLTHGNTFQVKLEMSNPSPAKETQIQIQERNFGG